MSDLFLYSLSLVIHDDFVYDSRHETEIIKAFKTSCDTICKQCADSVRGTRLSDRKRSTVVVERPGSKIAKFDSEMDNKKESGLAGLMACIREAKRVSKEARIVFDTISKQM